MVTISYRFSTRRDGDMRQAAVVDQFLHQHHLDRNNLVTAQQVHGATVCWVNESQVGTTIPGVDGLLFHCQKSDQVILGIKTADCIPVLLYDVTTATIAAVHSGWKGTSQHLVVNAIQEFLRHGSRIENIHCILGPHIRSCCYCVPEDRAALFQQEFNSSVAVDHQGQWFLELSAAVQLDLTRLGVKSEHITDLKICTASSVDKYYSYRKDSKDSFGEILGIIWLSGYN